MDLFIIDAIGPFFKGYDKDVINWSKIPFDNLEKNGEADKEKFFQIRKDFEKFVKKASEIGYNAVTLDDIAHFVIFDFYSARLRRKIESYQREYKKLVSIANRHGMKVFITTDIMFFNDLIANYTKRKNSKIIELLKKGFEYTFQKINIEGIILRIGEADGVDVYGDFLSNLTIRTPASANRYIKELLPVFEKYNKYMVFRTWTIGAYKIGDLIWNPHTYDSVFRNIDSDNLIISMKYGEGDFFAKLDLNPLFFRNDKHKKIIEFQTRRERDGFGKHPYYVGWEYERYKKELKRSKNVIGMSVWCQSGGWSRHRDLTFIENSSLWNEFNTYATLKIFRENYSADRCIAEYFDNKKMTEYLRTFNMLFEKIIYLDYSKGAVYLKRLMVPPQLWLHWDTISINPFVMVFYHSLFKKEDIKKDLDAIIEGLSHLKKIGKENNVPNNEYHYDTLILFAKCKLALYGLISEDKLLKGIEEYNKRYPESYKFEINLRKKKNLTARLLIKILVRKNKRYRMIDRLINTWIASKIVKIAISMKKKDLPDFVGKQATKIETILS